jgi:hypothetical protein
MVLRPGGAYNFSRPAGIGGSGDRPLKIQLLRPFVLALLSVGSLVAAQASGVSVRFDTDSPATAPFPSNRWTVFDGSQHTLRRVALPKPDCAVRPSDCADLDVLNALDGFSTQPRITIPFTGDIDPASVNSGNVYLLSLGDTLTLAGAGDRVGINQTLWNPATKTLVVQPDRLLRQHSRYLLVVTDGVRDAAGKKIKSGGWGEEFGVAHGRDRAGAEYRRDLRDAVQALRGELGQVVAASLFSTQSITPDLVKIHASIRQSMPSAPNFMIGQTTTGPVRALFPVASLAGIQFVRQTSTAGFTTSFVPTSALQVAPGAVAQVGYAQFLSPNYLAADRTIPATGTLTGQPQQQGSSTLVAQFFVPAGTKPAAGWPVAIFGHGFGDSMYGAPWTVAATLAAHGIASVSINVVGHGGGAAGTLNVLRSTDTPVQVPAGGRGFDQNGDGQIASTEGVGAIGARSLINSRDGLRQTVIDLMQLVRQVQLGIDIDGDGSTDLDATRTYYAGQSFGGIYGTKLLAVEPSIAAGVPNVPGGSITEIARLSPAFRILTGLALAGRTPSLLNLAPTATLPVPLNFNENLPLRDEPIRIDTVPGASAIAEYLDWAQWATQAGNPVSYARFIRKEPLPGHHAKPVIVQIAKGDVTVPNPTSSAIVRAGDLADRVTYFRNDLAYAANPALSKNPHAFLPGVFGAGLMNALMAQTQIATFFASHGTLVLDPDGAGLLFEVPIAGPLPETLNFIP